MSFFCGGQRWRLATPKCRRAVKIVGKCCYMLRTLLARPPDKAAVLKHFRQTHKKGHTVWYVLFCGGQRWIRTTEVEDVRFTV